MPSSPAIEATGLSKTYGSGVRALAGIDLRVERGEVFGFLGPNGAGKSTTIRLLLDLIRPTEGRATVLGYDTRTESVEMRRHVGYVPGDLRLYDRLTAEEHLESLARLGGDRNPELLAALVQRFGLPLDRPIRELSRGNRQKVGIVQAFMHRPDVLILDEPTSGLDPLLQGEFRALVRETAQEGRTVFLSSHTLDEVQQVADRVAIIRAGRLIDVDRVAALRARSIRHVTLVFAEQVDAAPFAALPDVEVQSAEGPEIRLSVLPKAMHGVVELAARHPVVDLVSEAADLEEIFLQLYREEPADG
jgi:beta-exotoxin I transport system ATP-binding protein